MSATKLPADHAERLERARLAVDGLSTGDAFGERFSNPKVHFEHFADRTLPAGPWRYTDDTEMALALLEVLAGHGNVEQDELSAVFARRYQQNPYRGYGATAHEILTAVASGTAWRTAAARAFGGAGSMGNGAAMRVAPVGAYFADDLEAVVAQARASAEVTHQHPEGQAGAIAVAVAAALAGQARLAGQRLTPRDLLEAVLAYTPPGEVHYGIEKAIHLPADYSVLQIAVALGNGSKVTAPDTVPFALWCAARHLDDFVAALWTTVSAFGDIDTNCAIVGGIVAQAVGRDGLPRQWLEAREPLPADLPRPSHGQQQ